MPKFIVCVFHRWRGEERIVFDSYALACAEYERLNSYDSLEQYASLIQDGIGTLRTTRWPLGAGYQQ